MGCSHIFTEVFPVRTEALPRLFAYRLDVRGGDISTIGGKLSYRLRRTFPGHWVWSSQGIVTDSPQDVTAILRVVEDLCRERAGVFGGLQEVVEDPHWRPTPHAQAAFVACGLLTDVEAEIRGVLAPKAQNLGKARVELVHELRGWVVDSLPAVSISISSRLLYREDLKAYATGLPKPEDVIGLWVADKSSTLKGETISIAGRVGAHRRRLLALTTRAEMRQIIEQAEWNELVVRVRAGYAREYDYVLSALRIIVRTEDFRRFNINPRLALEAMRIEPARRAQLVKPIADLAKARNLIGDGYTSRRTPHLFLRATDVGYAPRLRFGGNQIRPHDEKTLLKNLRELGLYKQSERFQSRYVRSDARHPDVTIGAGPGGVLLILEHLYGKILKLANSVQ